MIRCIGKMPRYQDFFDEHCQEISELERRFGSYVFPIDSSRIRNWLRQFGEENLGLGLKLLKCVDYYSPSRLLTESRELHAQLLAYKQLDNPLLLEIPTYFVDFSPSSGRSQDDFIPKYRLGAGLRHNRYNKNFLYLRDVNQFFDKEGITIVFLTDFIGTGKQVLDTWEEILWAISDKNEHILLAMCGYDSGIAKVQEATEDKLTIITNRRYGNEHRVFSPQNTTFLATEKEILMQLCNRAGEEPTGFRDTQSTTVFYFRCPNSTISVLRAKNSNWTSLFARHLE